jgi:outer membrane protein assembly factor BamD (BamD/ComL family)
MIKILFYSLLLSVFFSCSDNQKKELTDKNKLLIEIKDSEKKIYADTTMDLNVGIANNAIMLYSRYANSFPEDTSSAEYLFRAGELSKALFKGKLALSYYERIEENYPKYTKMPIVIFMQGFINESQLGDIKKAKFHYERYIEKYPKSKFAQDLKVMIENLGKSDEDLIKSFKEKEKNKPAV